MDGRGHFESYFEVELYTQIKDNIESKLIILPIKWKSQSYDCTVVYVISLPTFKSEYRVIQYIHIEVL